MPKLITNLELLWISVVANPVNPDCLFKVTKND